MAIHEKNRFVRIFHAVVAILMLVAGGVLVGTGIWLQVSDNAGPHNLVYNDDAFWKFVLNFGVAGMIVGVFLIVAAISGLIALSRKCVGSCFKVVYVVMALLILVVLVFITALSSVIRARGDAEDTRDFLEDAWQSTVTADPDEICNLEEFYKCRGFNDNECKECSVAGDVRDCSPTANCARCGVDTFAGVGCYDEIVASVSNFFLPVAIVGGILSGVIIVDIFMTCAL